MSEGFRDRDRNRDKEVEGIVLRLPPAGTRLSARQRDLARTNAST